jgi:hypothetical protein
LCLEFEWVFAFPPASNEYEIKPLSRTHTYSSIYINIYLRKYATEILPKRKVISKCTLGKAYFRGQCGVRSNTEQIKWLSMNVNINNNYHYIVI